MAAVVGSGGGERGRGGAAFSCSSSVSRPCDYAGQVSLLAVVLQRRVPTVQNCADDRRDSPGDALGPVLDMPIVLQRHMHSPRMSRSSTSLSWRRGCLPWS